MSARYPHVPVDSWETADKYLDGTVARKYAGNATYVHQRGTNRAVRYHDTDVVIFHQDGSITLDTGGHATALTARRMNAHTPANVRINRKDGTVYVTVDDGEPEPVHNFNPVRVLS